VQRGLIDGEGTSVLNFTALSERQRQEQDQRLDELSHSINRQHHITLQINDELDVHQGLLEGLDSDLDRTDSRLRKARRKLDTFARGVKENGW
jgi:syntaxin 8